MGIKSAAVYSEADTNALHVQYADKACFIGNSQVPESYISIPHIIKAVRTSGAQAVFQGYVLLSENHKFALTLQKEGVAFISPSVSSIKKCKTKLKLKK